MDKAKIQKHLKELLHREPKEEEVINAETDPNIVLKVLMENFDDLPERVEAIEKRLGITRPRN